MKKSRKLILGFIALGVVALLGTSAVFAEDQINKSQFSVFQMHGSQDRSSGRDVPRVISQKDYGALLVAVSEEDNQHGLLKKINQNNFSTFTEYSQAVKNKNFTNARKLANETGFRFGSHNKNGKHSRPVNNWIDHPTSEYYAGR